MVDFSKIVKNLPHARNIVRGVAWNASYPNTKILYYQNTEHVKREARLDDLNIYSSCVAMLKAQNCMISFQTCTQIF